MRNTRKAMSQSLLQIHHQKSTGTCLNEEWEFIHSYRLILRNSAEAMGQRGGMAVTNQRALAQIVASPPLLPFPTPPLLSLSFLLHPEPSHSFSPLASSPSLSLPSVPVTYSSPPCLWSFLLILLSLLSTLTDHLWLRILYSRTSV